MASESDFYEGYEEWLKEIDVFENGTEEEIGDRLVDMEVQHMYDQYKRYGGPGGMSDDHDSKRYHLRIDLEGYVDDILPMRNALETDVAELGRLLSNAYVRADVEDHPEKYQEQYRASELGMGELITRQETHIYGVLISGDRDAVEREVLAPLSQYPEPDYDLELTGEDNGLPFEDGSVDQAAIEEEIARTEADYLAGVRAYNKMILEREGFADTPADQLPWYVSEQLASEDTTGLRDAWFDYSKDLGYDKEAEDEQVARAKELERAETPSEEQASDQPHDDRTGRPGYTNNFDVSDDWSFDEKDDEPSY